MTHQSEDQLQRIVMQGLIDDQARGLPIVALHVPNEGLRSWAEGKRAKAKGLRAGAPDIIVFYGRAGQSLAIELKAMTGKGSAPQLAMHEALHGVGAPVFVVRTATGEEALAQARELISQALNGILRMPEPFAGPGMVPGWL